MIAWSTFDVGETRAACPSCGRGPRDKTLGVRINPDGAGVAHCFRCEFVTSTRGGRLSHAPVARVAAARTRERHETLSTYGADLWRACGPIAGVAKAYLEARSCVIPPADGALRWHPALRHPLSGHEGPALVALLTDAVTGEPRTLHRTWVRADGRKADVDPPRMLLGGHRKQGAVARLWPNDAVTGGLGIAEGIETALSLASAYRPVWAAIDAGNLAALPVLAGIQCLVLAADHDAAGVAAAETCARRWTAAGCEVRVLLAPTPRADLNDLARCAA